VELVKSANQFNQHDKNKPSPLDNKMFPENISISEFLLELLSGINQNINAI